MLEFEVQAELKGPQTPLPNRLTKADEHAFLPILMPFRVNSASPICLDRDGGALGALGGPREEPLPQRTCLRRDGTLQPQACMMPSSRRMCSRTCRYCSRRCSRRASTAESLRRDATPLLANLQRAEGAGESEALAAWPASSGTMGR